MIVRVTADANDDLRTIKSFLAHRNAAAADHVVGSVRRVVRRLRLLPRLGHTGAVHGTFEINVPQLPFVVLYRIDIGSSDQLIILRVYHHTQDRLGDED